MQPTHNRRLKHDVILSRFRFAYLYSMCSETYSFTLFLSIHHHQDKYDRALFSAVGRLPSHHVIFLTDQSWYQRVRIFLLFLCCLADQFLVCNSFGEKETFFHSIVCTIFNTIYKAVSAVLCYEMPLR